MYNNSAILTDFYPRVGFRQGTDTGYDIVDENNLQSTSGRYFQDINPLVTIPNIKDTHPDPDLTDDEFNEFLENVNKSAILQAIDTVLPSGDVLESQQLFSNADDYRQTTAKSGQFVGFKILVPDDVIAQVRNVTLEFNGETSLTLYLFHTSKTKALQTKAITTGLGTSVTLDWELNAFDNVGGYFLLGYYADDLGGAVEAYDRGWNFSDVMNDFYNIGIYNAYVSGDSPTRPNITSLSTTTETFGLNPFITVRKNHTGVLLENASRFDYITSLYVAAKLIDMMRMTTRSNRRERFGGESINALANVELNGNSEFNITGLYRQIKSETAKVFDDLFGKPLIMRGTLR